VGLPGVRRVECTHFRRCTLFLTDV
jgi:hypothetical protein